MRQALYTAANVRGILSKAASGVALDQAERDTLAAYLTYSANPGELAQCLKRGIRRAGREVSLRLSSAAYWRNLCRAARFACRAIAQSLVANPRPRRGDRANVSIQEVPPTEAPRGWRTAETDSD